MENTRALKIIAILLAVLAIALLGLLLLVNRPSRPVRTFTLGEEADPTETEVVVEVVEPEDGPLPRYITDRHEVRKGESMSLITGMYWDDIYLWPDLWIRQQMKSGDPDLIFPEEMVDIYNRLGQGDVYTDRELRDIYDSYLRVYRVFKNLGPEKDPSAWTLLYTATKYDHDFLDTFGDRLEPADVDVARRYVAEAGYLD